MCNYDDFEILEKEMQALKFNPENHALKDVKEFNPEAAALKNAKEFKAWNCLGCDTDLLDEEFILCKDCVYGSEYGGVPPYPLTPHESDDDAMDDSEATEPLTPRDESETPQLIYCENCDEPFHPSEIVVYDRDIFVCDGCHAKGAGSCVNCGHFSTTGFWCDTCDFQYCEHCDLQGYHDSIVVEGHRSTSICACCLEEAEVNYNRNRVTSKRRCEPEPVQEPVDQLASAMGKRLRIAAW